MQPVQIGDWHFHPMGRELRQGNEQIRLTELEAGVLRYLVARPGQTVSSDTLLRDVWEYAEGVHSRAVTHLMARLRKKLGQDGARIVTIYGEGFQLDIPDIGDLIGRSRLLAEIVASLELHQYVTLHGVAGVGKSRLARAVAERHPVVHWVPASDLQTAEDLFMSVATALSLEPAAYTAVGLGNVLAAAGPALLVVDAAEHLGPFAVEAFGRWVDQSESLRILATSRVLLAQERRILVPPLVPDAALRLFLRRADVVLPATSLPESVVADIVGTVDGLPLAVELAAARLRVLELQELRDEMASDIRILGGGEDSLAGVLQASWNALDEGQQRLLSAAALFPGGFTAKMLGAVAEIGTVVLLDTLDALARAALIVERPPEFRLLDVVKSFASDQTSDELSASFVAWTVERASRARNMVNTDSTAGLRLLSSDWPIYVAALARAQDDVHVAQLALALWAHGRMFGNPQRAAPYLNALELEALPVSIRIDVLQARWWLLAVAHQRSRGAPVAQAALALARRRGNPIQVVQSWVQVLSDRLILEGAESVVREGDALVEFAKDEVVLPPLVLGAALRCRADIAWQVQDYPAAVLHLIRVVELVSGRADTLANSRGKLSTVYLLMGEPRRALEVARAAYEEALTSNVATAILQSGGAYGAAAMELDDRTTSKRVYEEVLPVAHELGSVFVVDQIELALAQLEEDSGALESAVERIRDRARGKRPLIEGWASLVLAFHRHRAGDIASCLPLYEAASNVLSRTNWRLIKTNAIVWFALAMAEDGDPEGALRHLRKSDATAGLASVLVDVATHAVTGHVPTVSTLNDGAGLTLHRTVELARRLQADGERGVNSS